MNLTRMTPEELAPKGKKERAEKAMKKYFQESVFVDEPVLVTKTDKVMNVFH